MLRRALLCVVLSPTMAFTSPKLPAVVSSNWLREAEKKHSRVALLAVPSLLAIRAATGDDPVGWLNQQPVASQLIFYATAGILESYNLRRFDGLDLKADQLPGKLLPFEASAEWHAAEDGAGRAAMLLATGFLVHTLLA